MIRRLLSSIAIRQAALTALIAVVAVVGFSISALVTVQRAARADLVHTIDVDGTGLTEGMSRGGLLEITHHIADRLGSHSKDKGKHQDVAKPFYLLDDSEARPFYLLVDPHGKVLAGNMKAPPVFPDGSTLAEATADDEDVVVRQTPLENGAQLYVGRSLTPEHELIGDLQRHFFFATLVTLAAALAAGLLAARRQGKRVALINSVFDRFQEGEAAARVGEPNARDEFGELGRHVDTHLDRITQLLELQRQVSDNIAHELRTPLAHLDTHLRKALEQPEAAPLANDLRAARVEVRSIVGLFDSLLDIALTESQSTAERATIDLSQLAADLAELYGASAEEAGIDFGVFIAPEVRMRGEPTQVTRLITNLLDNAFKFVPPGACVRLSVAQGPVITVEDNGPGVPAADRELIFTRFGRSASAGSDGHGLGLALVKAIAIRHGMSVRVEDAHPGARFVVERKPRA